MKRFLSLLLVLVLGLSLCACGNSGSVRNLQINGTTDTTDADDLFVFTMEYGHLYSYDANTGETQLLIDDYCYSYDRDDEILVAVSSDGTVYRLNLENGNLETLVEGYENIVAVHMYDEGLILDAYDMNDGSTAYRYLYSGKKLETLALPNTAWDFHVIDGILYYYDFNSYEADNGEYTSISVINALDISGKKIGTPETIVETEDYLTTFECEDELYIYTDSEGWFEYDPDDGSRESIPFCADNSSTVSYMDDECCIYTVYDYSNDEETGEYTSVNRCFYDTLTEHTELPIAGEDSYASVQDVHADLALIEVSAYDYDEDDTFYETTTYYLMNLKDASCTEVQILSVNTKLFASGDFPVMDSSTARKPVVRDIYELFCVTPGISGAEPLCSTTHYAWLNIADGVADIALLAAPTEEEQAYLAEKGVEVEMKLYGGDGLVFIGNKACGVSSLTQEQIRDIYLGRITNWSELGGVDHAITVFYRDDQSGSQRLFESMLFDESELPQYEALGFTLEDTMSTLVDECLEDPYSIGYSIMTYLNDVYGQEELQAFSVDGVSPGSEHVADGTYPLSTKGYVVIRSSEAEDSPARRLYNWFGSSTSDYILNMNSIAPLHG